MDKSTFKVGDLVVIKSWDEMAEEFGLCSTDAIEINHHFISSMKYLCGREFMISSIDTDHDAVHGWEREGDLNWTIGIEMIKYAGGIDEDLDESDDLIQFLNEWG